MNQLNLFWETWIDVVDYEGFYQVNGIGDVKSLNYNHTGKEKILKPHRLAGGYLGICLFKEKQKKDHLIHRLVYEAFYGKIDDGFEIDHIDTDRRNNSIENLRCVTHKEQYSSNEITKSRQVETSKKRCKQVNQFDMKGNMIAEWESASEAARQLGYSQGSISNCCRGIYKQAYGFLWKYKEKEVI